ncbi:MAG: alpha-galactosidase [Clostridia bacterium]|nr:alpha-galactosidase [Clostridia bacterium]
MLIRYALADGEERSAHGGCADFSLEMREDSGRRTVLLTAKRDLTLLSHEEDAPPHFSGSRVARYNLIYLNGYQSWTDTRERYFLRFEKNLLHLPRGILDTYSFDRYGDYHFYPYDVRRVHGYDVFYRKGIRNGFLLNLNYKRAYLIVEVDRRTGRVLLKSDVAGAAVRAGESFPLVDFIAHNSYEEGLADFKRRFPERPIEKIFGYTSWYNYYQDIREDILLRDLEALDERFNLFQIDDGYETFVGDWLDVDAEKFPHGLSFLPEKAHARGFKAGIWLAPFVAEEKSRLFREHPEYFRRDAKGNFVKCGSNWSGFYALDLENEEVLAYIKKCLRHYADMGFDLFKLDFLYAANLPTYEGMTRSEAAERAYDFLREVLPDRLILGCGATLFNAIGKFDYMRIGPDVSLSFDDAFYMKFFHRERPSTKITIQNTIYRHLMNGSFFGNDPDVFLLREDNLSLSKGTRKALLTINALFGSVLMTSDNIGAYGEEQKAMLDEAFALFREGKVLSFTKRRRLIRVEYELRGERYSLDYDTARGVIL